MTKTRPLGHSQCLPKIGFTEESKACRQGSPCDGDCTRTVNGRVDSARHWNHFADRIFGMHNRSRTGGMPRVAPDSPQNSGLSLRFRVELGPNQRHIGDSRLRVVENYDCVAERTVLKSNILWGQWLPSAALAVGNWRIISESSDIGRCPDSPRTQFAGTIGCFQAGLFSAVQIDGHLFANAYAIQSA
jgi:hypothetical protein